MGIHADTWKWSNYTGRFLALTTCSSPSSHLDCCKASGRCGREIFLSVLWLWKLDTWGGGLCCHRHLTRSRAGRFPCSLPPGFCSDITFKPQLCHFPNGWAGAVGSRDPCIASTQDSAKRVTHCLHTSLRSWTCYMCVHSLTFTSMSPTLLREGRKLLD